MIVVTTPGKFENFSSRFGQEPEVGAGHRTTLGPKGAPQLDGIALPHRGKAGVYGHHLQSEGTKSYQMGAAAADPLAGAQSDLNSANNALALGIAASVTDLQAASLDFGDVADFSANATTKALNADPGNAQVGQAGAIALREAAKAKLNPTLDTAQAAVDAAANTVNLARADINGRTHPPVPQPQPPQGPQAPATPTNWTPWILGGIGALAFGTAGWFLWKHYREGARKNPVGARHKPGSKGSSHVQTLIFDKRVFHTEASAKRWAASHGYKSGKVDVTDGSYRVRQAPPEVFKKDSFRTISFRDGVKAVVARRR